MGCNCWCCFCYCCRNCYCCKDFDEEEDIGARGCCKYHDGEPMCPSCGDCLLLKRLVRARVDPCGCDFRINLHFIDIEWKNKITHRQGLLFISTFKLAVLSSLFIYCEILERRYYREWQIQLEAAKHPTGNQWRTIHYLSSTPKYDEDWIRRGYCNHALTTSVIAATIIGDLCVLIGAGCRLQFFCFIYTILGTLATLTATFYQPMEYYYRYLFYRKGRHTYKLWNLAISVPLSFLHYYQLWVMIFFIRQLRNPYGDLKVEVPTEEELKQDRVDVVARELAYGIAEDRHLTLRDTFYPNESLSPHAVAQKFILEHQSKFSRHDSVTAEDITRELDQ